MKPHELGRQLVERLLLPLMRGGAVRPLPPVGLAGAFASGELEAGAELFEEVRALKLRRARALYPVDELGDLSADEWSLLAALNDFLQLSNPSLKRGWGGAANAGTLAGLVARSIQRAGAPTTLAGVLSRHALFSRIVELTRQDTVVSWWTGSQRFVGREVPARLTAWPRLRRVSRRIQHVSLWEMGYEASGGFEALLRSFLAASPLTLFTALGSGHGRFRWVGSALSLTSLPLGRRLALRCLLSARDVPTALAELSKAADELEKLDSEAFLHAQGFVEEAGSYVALLRTGERGFEDGGADR